MQTQNVSSSSLETLTRARLAEIIHERIGESVGYTKSLSTQFVDAFFDEICNALIRNEAVKISSFGTFLVRHKNPRVGRNPKTGEEAVISERQVVSFRASQNFKVRVNDV